MFQVQSITHGSPLYAPQRRYLQPALTGSTLSHLYIYCKTPRSSGNLKIWLTAQRNAEKHRTTQFRKLSRVPERLEESRIDPELPSTYRCQRGWRARAWIARVGQAAWTANMVEIYRSARARGGSRAPIARTKEETAAFSPSLPHHLSLLLSLLSSPSPPPPLPPPR